MQNIKSTNEFSKEQATSENTKREKTKAVTSVGLGTL